jgi:beta-galactosidase GanA
VTLLLTKTGETKRGLTTTTVLLWQIDRKLVYHVSRVAAQGAEKRTITIHDDEAELLIIFQQLRKRLSVELVVAQVQGRVDWTERLEVDVDLPFLAFSGQDFSTVHNQAIRWNLVVQLETLLCGCDGGQNRLSVDTGLDVGGGTLLDC